MDNSKLWFSGSRLVMKYLFSLLTPNQDTISLCKLQVINMEKGYFSGNREKVNTFVIVIFNIFYLFIFFFWGGGDQGNYCKSFSGHEDNTTPSLNRMPVIRYD